MAQGEPRTADEWEALCSRFSDDADAALKIGMRQVAWERYGYAVEAAAKALILRRGVLPVWPLAGEPQANQVHSHNISALLKFAKVSHRLSVDRGRDKQLRDAWLIVREWFPNRYGGEPEARKVNELARSAKVCIAWMRRIW